MSHQKRLVFDVTNRYVNADTLIGASHNMFWGHPHKMGYATGKPTTLFTAIHQTLNVPHKLSCVQDYKWKYSKFLLARFLFQFTKQLTECEESTHNVSHIKTRFPSHVHSMCMYIHIIDQTSKLYNAS